MNRRVGEVVLIAIALVLTLYGVFSDAWFSVVSSGGPERVDVGLRAIKACGDGRCESLPLTQIEESKAVTMGGNVAFFAGLFASVLAVIAAGLHLGGKGVAGPISPARLAAAFFIVSALGALVFLAVRPGRDRIELAMGAAGPMTVAGGIFGAVGAGMIAAANRRAVKAAASGGVGDGDDRRVGEVGRAAVAPETSWGAAGAGGPGGAPVLRGAMAPACPQCAAPTEFVDAHQRWFCRGCRAYV